MSRPGIAVPVLRWHGVGPGAGDPLRVSRAAFERQLDLVVAAGRTPLTATELAQCLVGRRPLPTAPVVLTFDDGHDDLAEHTVEALAGRDLRATVFATTGFLGRPGHLDVAGLRTIADADVEIGAHSVTHPHLDLLPADAARREIGECRRILEDLLGRPVTAFAYPHGSHDRRTRELVARAGYLTAHAVKNAVSHPDDDVFAVARYTVRASTTDRRFEAVLAGGGAPPARSGERLATSVGRFVRRCRAATRPRVVTA